MDRSMEKLRAMEADLAQQVLTNQAIVATAKQATVATAKQAYAAALTTLNNARVLRIELEVCSGNAMLGQGNAMS